MEHQRKNILGISPGTRYTGFAVIKDMSLIDWRMKTFKGKWSTLKLRMIEATIKRHIEKYAINVIALKVPHPARSSRELELIIKVVKKVTNDCKIGYYPYCWEDIKSYCPSENRYTKNVLIDFVLNKYPEVRHVYQREKQNRWAYYIKIFEAIALAHFLRNEVL